MSVPLSIISNFPAFVELSPNFISVTDRFLVLITLLLKTEVAEIEFAVSVPPSFLRLGHAVMLPILSVPAFSIPVVEFIDVISTLALSFTTSFSTVSVSLICIIPFSDSVVTFLKLAPLSNAKEIVFDERFMISRLLGVFPVFTFCNVTSELNADLKVTFESICSPGYFAGCCSSSFSFTVQLFLFVQSLSAAAPVQK